jgi:hypothetical protein
LVSVDLPDPDGPTMPTDLARADGERDILQDFLAARRVAKRHAAKFQRSLGGGRLAMARLVGSGTAFKISPMRSSEMRTCWKSCQICDSRSTGWATVPGDHVEGHQRADAHLAVDHRLGAEQQQRGGRELADILIAIWPPPPRSVTPKAVRT